MPSASQVMTPSPMEARVVRRCCSDRKSSSARLLLEVEGTPEGGGDGFQAIAGEEADDEPDGERER